MVFILQEKGPGGFMNGNGNTLFHEFRLPDLDRVLTWFFGKQYGTKV